MQLWRTLRRIYSEPIARNLAGFHKEGLTAETMHGRGGEPRGLVVDTLDVLRRSEDATDLPATMISANSRVLRADVHFGVPHHFRAIRPYGAELASRYLAIDRKFVVVMAEMATTNALNFRQKKG
ncbi:hypothetical protein [Agrobacterium sp. P15N1-A]|uniref:hypothetical protein n=1 Tax=Agrobacterium sp. P15N1-A TaxID=3342820 RepID=UPI0037D53DAA